MKILKQDIGVGKRKTSIARVILKPSSNTKFLVNKTRNLEEYFNNRTTLIKDIMTPLIVTNNLNKFDVFANVHGGGNTGQADSIKYGIAKALLKLDESLRPVLREENLLTRDTRVVERKKFGRKKARKHSQFSKR